MMPYAIYVDEMINYMRRRDCTSKLANVETQLGRFLTYFVVLNVVSAMLSDIKPGLALPSSSSKPIEASLKDGPGDEEDAASVGVLNSEDLNSP